MTRTFQLYDVLGILVPGVLFLAWLPLCFPGTKTITTSLSFPDTFSVLVLTASSVFIGHVIQAIGSLLEPALFLTWGGRPSDRGLTEGLGSYLPHDSSQRIRAKLLKQLGEDAADQSLFLFAIQLSDGSARGRATRFNSLYAYHRALLTTLILGAVSLVLAQLLQISTIIYPQQFAAVLIVALFLVVLTWHRAKQCAFYYVREVLFTTERVLGETANRTDEPSIKPLKG